MNISDFCEEESSLIIYILGIPELYFSKSLWRVMQFLMTFYHLQIPLGSSLTQNNLIRCCSLKKAACCHIPSTYHIATLESLQRTGFC